MHTGDSFSMIHGLIAVVLLAISVGLFFRAYRMTRSGIECSGQVAGAWLCFLIGVFWAMGTAALIIHATQFSLADWWNHFTLSLAAKLPPYAR